MYGRPSARQEAIEGAESEKRARSAFNSPGDGESRIARIARDAFPIVRDTGEGRAWNMSGISHRWIRITGKRSRFVMTFVFGSEYFDICLGLGKDKDT